MKRIISIVLSLIMIAGLLATVSFTASADETPAPSAPPTVTDAKGNSKLNLVYCVEQFANGSDYSDIIRPIMFDGDRGSNTTGNERVVNVKWDASGTKAKATCTDYGNGSPTGHNAGSNNTPAKNNKNVKIGGTNYKYYMSASVVGGATLTGLCVYFQGYKVAIFDHAFDILYSKDDGATWTKFIEVTDPFNPEAKYHLENYDAEAAYGAKYEDTKIVDPAYFYVDFSDTPLTGVTNIAYACKIPRCNNTNYVTRFTEFEVYGTLPTNYTPNGAIKTETEFLNMNPYGDYYLDSDLTINTTNPCFFGKLDGKGHTVTLSVPMFRSIAGEAKNIVFKGSVDTTGEGSSTPGGSLAYFSKNPKLGFKGENLVNYATVKASQHAGGILGMLFNGEMTGCVNYGDISSITAGSGAGIVGSAGRSGYNQQVGVTYTDCINFGTIYGMNSAGGIEGWAGHSDYTGVFTAIHCANFGDVSNNNKYYAGGIFSNVSANGDIEYAVMRECINAGNIKNNNDTANTGGFAGQMIGYINNHNTVIENCIGAGTVYSQQGHTAVFGCSSTNTAKDYVISNYYIREGDGTEYYSYSSTAENLILLTDFMAGIDYVYNEVSKNTAGRIFRFTDADLASGKLAYDINTKAGKTIFYQNLGGDNADAVPTVDPLHGTIILVDGVYTNEKNPDTSDGAVTVYAVTLSLSLVSILSLGLVFKKRKENQ